MAISSQNSVGRNTHAANSNMILWSCESNWAIAQGSLKDSIAVDSSDHAIAYSDPGPKSPLILNPPLPDSAPCEIKLCFEQKYEIVQVYVRSTARTYEIYYTQSPRSINEYLCTVRCGVAERDDKVLQTSSPEVVANRHGEGPSRDITSETASDKGNIVTGEDDWINIRAVEIGQSSSSDNSSTDGLSHIQDLYEATAQINDSDPCFSLTIRFLSLQEKGHVFVDEIYVFVEPVETPDSGNEASVGGNSMQSSLMAMFMPTLLQMSKSGFNRVEDKFTSNEVIKDDKMEIGSMKNDKLDYERQFLKQKEPNKDTAESVELKDPAVSSEYQPQTSAKKCADPNNINDLLPGRLEIALEQVVSRLSRVEDICLRFEEKLLKPIEKMEARLQQVENQLEKLVRNSHDLPHFTRISAPAFLCSESDSSSLCNDHSEYPPHETSDLEKNDISCNQIPDLSSDVNFHPSLVVSAAELSLGEAEDENDDLNHLKDSPEIKPKKTLSLESALAASLDAFLSNASINDSELIETSSQVNEGKIYQGHAECFDIKAVGSPAADNVNEEPPRYAQVLTIKAPDFTLEETENEEEHLSYPHSSSDSASVTENEKDCSKEMAPPFSNLFTSSDFSKNGSSSDLGSASNGNYPSVSVKESGTCLGNSHLNGSSEVSVIEYYFQVTNTGPEPQRLKTNHHQGNASSEQVLCLESENVSDVILSNHTANISNSVHASLVDFQFPILEVKFTCDTNTSAKSSLEALLGASAEPDTEAHSINASRDDDGRMEQIDAATTSTDLLSENYPLVDVGLSGGDGSSNLEDVPLITPQVCVSLI